MRRHRTAWLFLRERTNLFDGLPKTMLHVSPELTFEARFKKIPKLRYIPVDRQHGRVNFCRVRLCLDIAKIPCPDNAFEVIFCSHVLEHVPDDRQAMSEFARVLKPHGWAIFMIPYRADQLTDEDPMMTDPTERERRFGQHDHVRMYGHDFADRLQNAGFRVTPVRIPDIVGSDQLHHFGMNEKEVLFYCEKAAEVV